MRASLPRVDRVTGRRHFLRMLMTPLRRCSVQPARSMIGRWWVAALAVVAGAACSDASGPGPNDFYEWRLIVASPGGTGDDSLTFHWPQNRLPVRIWVEDAADLPGHVAAGLTAWRQGLTQSQFAGEVVSDSTTADVIVRAGVGPGAQFARVRLHSALAPECSGATDLDITPDHTQLRLPVRIYVDPRDRPVRAWARGVPGAHHDPRARARARHLAPLGVEQRSDVRRPHRPRAE